jgi:hypothetical protein
VVGSERIAAYPDVIQARLYELVTGIIEERELFKAEGEADLLRLARPQRHPCETLQATVRLVQTCAAVAYITLNDFGGGDLSSVRDGGLGDDDCLRRKNSFADGQTLTREPHVRVSELSVGQAKTEGKECGVRGVDVAREPTCGSARRNIEVGIPGPTPCGQLVIVERLLALGLRKAHRQPPAGRDLSVENARNGVACFGSREPDFEDSIDLGRHRCEDERTSGEKQHYHGFTQ